MNIGFSYIGLIFLLMLMIPNIIWSKHKPKDYDKYVKNENKLLLIFEKIGEVGNTCLTLIFADFNINTISIWSIILLIAFFLLGIYGKNPFLIVSTIILGIGHIGIHLNHKKEAEL